MKKQIFSYWKSIATSLCVFALAATAIPNNEAAGTETIKACVNQGGLIRIVQNEDECRNNETAIQLQTAAEPASCPCFTAEDLDKIVTPHCRLNDVGPNDILITDVTDPDSSKAASLHNECYYQNTSIEPWDYRYKQGLFDDQSRECIRLLWERADELGLVCGNPAPL